MNTKPQGLKAPTATDIKRLKEFLLWAKDAEILLHQVDFGSVKITLTDTELYEELEEPKADDTMLPKYEPQSMYDELASRRGIKPQGNY